MQGYEIGVNANLGLTFKMLMKQIGTRTTIYSNIHIYLGSEKKPVDSQDDLRVWKIT